MKKILSFLLILVMAISLVVPALGEAENGGTSGEYDLSVGCKTLDATTPIGGSERIAKTCDSIFLYECNSDTLVYARNPDVQLPPGSLAKIMTCLLLGEGDVQEEVHVRQDMLDQVPQNVATIDLRDGEIVPMEQLIYAIMVESANDAVAVGAIAKCGSMEAFVNLMNERAAALGCTNTHFGNPYGFEDGQTYSSARDLAKITRAAMDVPAFWDAYCTSFYDMPATNMSDVRELSTNNYMLFNNSMFAYYDSGVLGGKMGSSAGDRWHAVINSDKEGMHFIVVTMNGTNTSDEYNGAILSFGNLEDARIVLDYGYSEFKVSETVYVGQAISQYPVENGANDVVLGATGAVMSVLPANMTSREIKRVITVDESLLKAPLAAGIKVGTLECWYRNFCVGVTDLVTIAPVEVSTASVPLEGVQNVAPQAANTPGNSRLRTVLEVFGAVFLVILAVYSFFTARAMILRSRRQRRKSDRSSFAERRSRP